MLLGMIDQAISKYFWDVKLSDLDLVAHKNYIIERILDMGDERAVSWLRQNYSKADILTVVRQSRRLSPKSKNFWTLAAQDL